MAALVSAPREGLTELPSLHYHCKDGYRLAIAADSTSGGAL